MTNSSCGKELVGFRVWISVISKNGFRFKVWAEMRLNF